MPPAYLIANVDVHDPAGYEEYRRQVPATVAQYGGSFIVRGGALESLEGTEPKGRMVVLKFPSMAQAKAWYDSTEYAGPKALRQSLSTSNVCLVEGYE